MGCFCKMGASTSSEDRNSVERPKRQSVLNRLSARVSRKSLRAVPKPTALGAYEAKEEIGADLVSEKDVEKLVASGGKPGEIADAYYKLGHSQLAKKQFEKALESFSFSLTYSTLKKQAQALYGLGLTKLALAKKLSKGSRSNIREEALHYTERGLQIANRFNLDVELVEKLNDLLRQINQLAFKVSV